MRLDSVALTNFRIFRESGQIPLRPLTVLVGKNSSGKSSVAQALLLLRQSIEGKPLGTESLPLVLTGHLVDAGSFRDLVHAHRVTSKIDFRFDFTPERAQKPTRAIQLGHRGLFAVRPDISQVDYDYVYPYYLHHRGPDVSANVLLSFRTEVPFGPSLCRLELSVPSIGEASFVRTTGLKRGQHWRFYATGLPTQSLRLFFTPSGFPVIEPRSRAALARVRRREARLSLRRFLEIAREAFDRLSWSLRNTRMLGPLRSPPSRRYGLTGGVTQDLGLGGEQAANILLMEQLLRRAESRNLQRAVGHWLEHLGLATAVDVRRLGSRLNLFELLLAGAGHRGKSNYADVGYGISQVLPILVQGLLMPEGSTMIVQQPELHLHPDAQAQLVDYFIYLATHGVNVMLETHSEYMFVRIRRRLAEGGTSTVLEGEARASRPITNLRPTDVALLLVEQARGGSRVRELRIDREFQLPDLPAGFMTQALEDRVAILQRIER